MEASAATERSWTYKLTNSLKEDHGHPVYCVSFNCISKANHNVFASCGANRATVYKCKEGGFIEILQSYIDEDKEEELFACKWGVNTQTGAPLLLVAGKTGLLKVLNTVTQELDWCAEGHGSAINDIAIHPTEPNLVLTASRDSALRLWNIQTKVCVLIMTGEEAHRNEVLSLDFHPLDGNRFVSAGMDNTVKLWSMEVFSDHLDKSFDYDPACGKVFNTKDLTHAKFSSHKVHFNYVDCVRFIGNDLIASKSVDNKIILWRPSQQGEDDEEVDTSGHVHLVQELELDDCENMWFLRFERDALCRVLACGTRTGQVLLFDPHTVCKKPKARLKRSNGLTTNTSPVRQAAVSWDGSILIACCDDSTIWRWDNQRKA